MFWSSSGKDGASWSSGSALSPKTSVIFRILASISSEALCAHTSTRTQQKEQRCHRFSESSPVRKARGHTGGSSSLRSSSREKLTTRWKSMKLSLVVVAPTLYNRGCPRLTTHPILSLSSHIVVSENPHRPCLACLSCWMPNLFAPLLQTSRTFACANQPTLPLYVREGFFYAVLEQFVGGVGGFLNNPHVVGNLRQLPQHLIVGFIAPRRHQTKPLPS